MGDSDNSEFEILFWSVFHNIFLFKKIFHHIHNEEWVVYSNYKQYHLNNRIKFKDIHSLHWMLENKQYQLLKYKLNSNELIEINNNGLKSLIQLSVKIKKQINIEISKDEEYNLILYKELLNLLWNKGALLTYEVYLLQYSISIANRSFVIPESISLILNEIIELIIKNNLKESFYECMQLDNSFLLIESTAIQNKLLDLNIYKTNNNRNIKLVTFSDTIQFINDSKVSKGIIKKHVSKSIESLLLVIRYLNKYYNCNINIDGNSSIKELEKEIIKKTLDKELYKEYLIKYDEPIKEISLLKVLYEYCILSFSVNIYQYLIEIKYESDENSNKTIAIYGDYLLKEIKEQLEEEEPNLEIIQHNYNKLFKFIKVYFNNNCESSIKKQLLIDSIINIIKIVPNKELYEEFINIINTNCTNEVILEFKLPNSWNPIIIKLSKLFTNIDLLVNKNIKRDLNLVIQDRDTINWLVENKSSFIYSRYLLMKDYIEYLNLEIEQYAINNLKDDLLFGNNIFINYFKDCNIKEINKSFDLNYIYNGSDLIGSQFIQIIKYGTTSYFNNNSNDKFTLINHLIDEKWISHYEIIKILSKLYIEEGDSLLSNEIYNYIIQKFKLIKTDGVIIFLKYAIQEIEYKEIEFALLNFGNLLDKIDLKESLSQNNQDYLFLTNGCIANTNYSIYSDSYFNSINKIIENYYKLSISTSDSILSIIINDLYNGIIKMNGITFEKVREIKELIENNTTTIINHSEYHSFFYLYIKSPKLIKYIMERDPIAGLILVKDYNLEKLNKFNKLDQEETDFHFNDEYVIEFISDQDVELPLLQPLLFTFDYIFNSHIDHIILKLMSQYKSITTTDQDSLYLLQIRNYNLINK